MIKNWNAKKKYRISVSSLSTVLKSVEVKTTLLNGYLNCNFMERNWQIFHSLVKEFTKVLEYV